MARDLVPNPAYYAQGEVFHVGDRPFVHYEEARTYPAPFRSERCIRTCDTINPRHWSLTPARKREIAERKQADEALRNVEAYLARIRR